MKLIDLDIVEAAMSEIGFDLVKTEEGPMDSGLAEFSDGKINITICKERSIWEIWTSKQELVPLGLWRGFPDTVQFIEALISYTKMKRNAEQTGWSWQEKPGGLR